MDFTDQMGLYGVVGNILPRQGKTLSARRQTPGPPSPTSTSMEAASQKAPNFVMTQQSTSPRAAITTPHYLASEAGRRVLAGGGNAIEAIVAAGAVLAVVYPQMCTLGGDAFYLVYNARTGELKGINASGKSGSKVNRKVYEEKHLSAIPSRGRTIKTARGDRFPTDGCSECPDGRYLTSRISPLSRTTASFQMSV